MLVWIVALLGGAYLAVVLAMYLAQTRLIFPAYLMSSGQAELPRSARRLRITAPDGTRLAGLVFAPTRAPDDATLLLGFGGNLWDVENMALRLHQHFPSMHVAGFHYRGYRPSEGRASAAGVLADALAIFDALQREVPATRTIAIGFSIGTPVSAYLARDRALAGLILVTPFDSLVELARDQFRWLPVRALLRHHMPTVDFVRDVLTPTALIAAGRDSIVPARRTEPLRRVIPNLVFDRIVAEAEHNDLYDRPQFWSALGEAVGVITAGNGAVSVPARPDERARQSASATGEG